MNLSNLRHILIIRISRIGDIIVTSFVFDLIKKHIPGIKIDLLTSPVNENVIKYDNNLNHTFYYKKDFNLFGMIKNLKKNNYDLIIELNDNFSRTSKFLFRLLKNKNIAAYNYADYGKLVNYPITIKSHENTHIIERIRDFFSELGFNFQEQDIKPVFHLGKNENSAVCNLIKHYKVKHKITAINISAGSESREWNVFSWIRLIANLSELYPDMKFIILSDNKKSSTSEILINSMNKNIFIKQTLNSIQHFAAYIVNSDFLISPDTSAIHIACAFNIPTIGLYNNSVWNLNSWRPYQRYYEIVQSKTEFVNDINYKEVLESFNHLYSRVINS